jgi:hypothetical protein
MQSISSPEVVRQNNGQFWLLVALIAISTAAIAARFYLELTDTDAESINHVKRATAIGFSDQAKTVGEHLVTLDLKKH